MLKYISNKKNWPKSSNILKLRIMEMKKLLIYAVLLCLSVILFDNCTGKSKPQSSDKKVLTDEQLIQRGNYLVTIIGCSDCHSPKRMGPQGPETIPELMLSGYPADLPIAPIDKNVLQKGWILFSPDLCSAVGPWGISFSANITSDATGIGNWPKENFIRAMKLGYFKGIEGGRLLLPPMPWEDFAKMSDDDLNAIYAFLKSTKPVHNIVPMTIAPADIK
jgi:hypothetical protein